MAAQNEVTPEEFANFIKRASANINKALWEYMSNERSDRNIKRLLGRSGFEYDSEAIQKSIIEPSWYLIEKGGKRIRPIITLLVIEALGKDPMDYIEFSMIPEILHTATLVHDDIEDSSETRRGALSVYKKYGTDIALNLGDFLFFFPIKVLLDSKKLDDQVKYRILKAHEKHMIRIGLGQATDIAWHRMLTDISKITEDNYMRVAFDKTGVLLSFAAELGAIIGGAKDADVEKLGKFASMIGVAFQIEDDILNIIESELSDNKGGIGDDIQEGKVTLIVVHALNHSSKKDRARLIEILKAHTKSEIEIKEAISIMERSGSVKYAKKVGKSIVDGALRLLDKSLPDSRSKNMIRMLASTLINRNV